jgi:putative tryptophan/tyrosine transport system substrate-binding protein
MSVGRRTFIAGLGAAAAWPFASRAQQPAMPVIGYLHAGSREAESNNVAAFRSGLGEIGYSEGRNVSIEYRWGENDNGRIPELAADLARRGVRVIATPGSTGTALAAKAATSTIPIVFSTGDDPVEAGLVAGLNQPGGNVTGFTSMNTELMGKRLELMHELLPTAQRYAVLINPNLTNRGALIEFLRPAASAIRGQVEIFDASSPGNIETAFASMMRERADALLVGGGAPFIDHLVQLITLATYNRLPAIYISRMNAQAGGLISYGSPSEEQFRQAGIYAGRVLKGEKPADLPVMRATKFQLVINLQTARAFGIDVPPTLLARADEVIE